MKHLPPKTLRCAVYTRKSTEHNLDLAFNSLDAQREASEAYVKSQAHEGWCLLPDRYDDGGLSGASLQRPALQQLLEDIRTGKVDVVVVYKVDRLTRSLADFAKLVEEFDTHAVAFVSVTQSFNTTSSMGRLTLNVLLSFAQFEREVIGERVRDKIAASKRKGIWVGGPVPLGYRSADKALVIVPEDAAIVRLIYARYLAVGSIRLLIEDLHQRGIYPRGRIGTNLGQGEAQRTIEPRRFMVGPLGHILKNQFYIGDVAYRGEVHLGQHAAIIDRATFAAVQQRLRAAAVTRTDSRSGSARLLTGLLYDAAGNRMSPSHACKKGVRYRYYVSQALQQNRPVNAGTVTRVSAPDIEAVVVAAVRGYLAENDSEERNMTAIDPTDRDVIAGQVVRVVPGPKQVEIILRGPDADLASPQTLTVPSAPRRGRLGKGLASEPSGAECLDPQTRAVLLTAIGKARLWIDDLMEGRVGSIDEIAEREGKGERHIRLLMPLAFVSPWIVGAIVDGTAPAGLTVTGLARALPHGWSEQARQLGIA